MNVILDMLRPRSYLSRLERLFRLRDSKYSPSDMRETRKRNGVGRVRHASSAAHINYMASLSACYRNPSRLLPLRVWKQRKAS